MREAIIQAAGSYKFEKRTTNPAWQARVFFAITRVILIAVPTFFAIVSTAFLAACPAFLTIAIPCALLANALFAIFQIDSVWHGTHNRIKKLRNHQAKYGEGLWSAATAERLQKRFALCGVLLVIAAFGLCVLPLPVVASAALICFLLLAFSLKSVTKEAMTQKKVDVLTIVYSLLKRLPLIACFLAPLVTPLFFPAFSAVVGFSICLSLMSSFFYRIQLAPFPILFCVMGLFVSFAAPPVLPLLASLLLINIVTCFTTDSLMEGLHEGAKQSCDKPPKPKEPTFSCCSWMFDSLRECFSNWGAERRQLVVPGSESSALGTVGVFAGAEPRVEDGSPRDTLGAEELPQQPLTCPH